MWDSKVEGFDVYITRDFEEIDTISLQGDERPVYDNGETRFKQGELGNCWLTAATESLRQQNNQTALKEVVQVDGNSVQFRFWKNGEYQQKVTLATDAVPARDRNPIFTHNVEGKETWGILLEKAYAKWVGSYEGLEGGFWADAIQSFTGGVVERISIKKDGIGTDKLFDIMKTSYSNGSSLCCIQKETDNTEYVYHACCITAVHDEDGNRSVHVYDPFTEEYVLTFDEFTNTYHRLDLCHTNWDNLSGLQGRNIAPTPWESQLFPLQMKNRCGELNITLTGTDDDQEDCILAIELIQDIKPAEGEKLSYVKPWEGVVCLQLDVNDKTFTIEVPQETHCFTLNPGPHSVKVSTDEDKHREIYVRLLSKSSFTFEQNQEE